MTCETIQIVEASRDDAAVLANIIRASFQDVADLFYVTPETCPVFPAFIQPGRIEEDMDKGTTFYFARVNGLRVGCIGMSEPLDEECVLRRLAVMPEFRHHGLGRMLVDFVLDKARQLALQRVTLGTVGPHTRLRKWYEAIGFVLTHKKQYDHLPFDVAYMKYELK